MNNFGYPMPMANTNMMPYNSANSQGNLVIVDLAAVMDAYSLSMMRAFEMGRQAALASATSDDNTNAKTSKFIGVYDAYAYGVYDNEETLSMSNRYWHNSTMKVQGFKSYEDAFNFANAGVAGLKNIELAMVTPMQYKINWRQVV